MKVRFNRSALADIAEILDYVGERNPRAAAALSEQFEQAARLIGFMPEIAPRTSRPNLHRFVSGNYLIVYEITAGEAVIHYVRHGARKRPWEDD
jgi:toxin ParE1/3/4